jgi:diacylglycerol kinase (ATP)
VFDVMLIGDVTKRDLAFVLPKTYKGKHLPHPRLELLRGSSVTVDSDEPLPIELDGEQPGTTPVHFELRPRALALRVPAAS